MSQILDALRRAEAQRSRGRVPSLHGTAGQVMLAPGQAASTGARRPLMIGAALLLALALIGALFLLLRPADSLPTTALRGDPSVAASPPMKAAESAATVAAVTPSSVAAADAQPLVGLPRKAQVSESHNEPPARVVAEKPQAAAATPDPPTKPLPPTSGAVRSTGGLAVEVPARQDLPAEIQRSLPPITVSGTVYSSDPAQRMLVVNGELWHEGDQIRPGLVLEQIRRRDAVLRFNGTRFTVGP